MFMLGLHETIDQMPMANIVRWHGLVLRMALYFEVKGQRRKGSQR